MVILRDGFFLYLTLTRLMDSFSCSAFNITFYIEKRLPEVPEYAEMGHDKMTSLKHKKDVT